MLLTIRASLLIPLATGIVLGVVGGARAQDPEQVEIQTRSVADGVWMLLGQGGNIGVSAGADGIFLIDDQFAPLTAKIRAALATLQGEGGTGAVRFVVNTHWHGDHTGGNDNLGRAGALIVAHDAVRERMSVPQFQRALGRHTPASPPTALPVVTFADGVTFHLNGDRIRVHHVAHAHTDGDSIVHFESANVLHMGDTFFNGTYPFIDLDSGGSIEGMIAAVDRGLALAGPETRIIPGHGALSDAAGLQLYRQMLVTLRDRVRAAQQAGQSLDAWIATQPTADLDAAWGGGFVNPEAVQRTVWQSLAGSQ